MYDSVRRVGASTHWQVVDEHDHRGVLGRVDEEVAGGQGDGERLDRLVHALQGERGPDGRRPRRRQLVDAVEQAVEQAGQPRPGQLELGLDPAQAHDPARRLVGQDQRRRLVEHGRLADAGLADDGQRPALADRRPGGQTRRWRRRRPAGRAGSPAGHRRLGQGRSWRFVCRSTGSPGCGTVRSPANISDGSSAIRPSCGQGADMGAGARLAEERDRWPDHWRVADLEQEEEHLLDLLDPAEELLAAVPGRRTSDDRRPGPGADRRHRSPGARHRSAAGRRLDVDARRRRRHARARRRSTADGAMPFRGGRLELDLDEDALRRLWDTVDGLPPGPSSADTVVGPAGPTPSPAAREQPGRRGRAGGSTPAGSGGRS